MWPHGRAVVDINNLDPFAVDDRTGFLVNHSALQWQYEWRGNQLQNLYILVTDPDTPQEQFRPVIIPPDPEPVRDPRPPFWAQQEATIVGPLPDTPPGGDDDVTP